MRRESYGVIGRSSCRAGGVPGGRRVGSNPVRSARPAESASTSPFDRRVPARRRPAVATETPTPGRDLPSRLRRWPHDPSRRPGGKALGCKAAGWRAQRAWTCRQSRRPGGKSATRLQRGRVWRVPARVQVPSIRRVESWISSAKNDSRCATNAHYLGRMMTAFSRIGHYRTNWRGKTFWVEGHSVHRDDWHRTTYRDSPSPPTVHPIVASIQKSHRRRPERSALSTRMPVVRCAAHSVYYYENEHGSRVFFDDIGIPWPKHPCTDTGLQVFHQGAYPTARTVSATFELLPWWEIYERHGEWDDTRDREFVGVGDDTGPLQARNPSLWFCGCCSQLAQKKFSYLANHCRNAVARASVFRFAKGK